MKREFAQARAQEQEAIGRAPPRLPAHAGEAQQQMALESDLVYQRLVLTGLTVAFFAGTGFGRLPQHAGGSLVSAALWGVTAAGLAARCVGARAAWSTGPVREAADRLKALCADYGVQDWRPLLSDDRAARLAPLAAAQALPADAVEEIRAELDRLTATAEQAAQAQLPALRMLAVLAAPYAVLGNVGAVPAGLWSGIGALAAAGLLWLMSRERSLVRPLGIAASVAIGLGVPWATAPADTNAALLAEAAGLGCAAGVIFLARDPLGTINVPQAFTRIAAITWAYSAWRAGAADLPHSLFVLAAGAALIALDTFTIRRSSFIPTVAAAMFLQLAAAPPGPTDLHAPLWAQIPAALVVFALLIAAGYRHALAAMLRLPPATYRRAPLCIVPRLDRTRDHPAEIYVV